MRVNVEALGILQAIARAAELLADPRIPAIFEGLFEFEGVRVRLDILERAGGGAWRLCEVKLSTQLKEDHLDDIAIQAYVLAGAGISLDRSVLMHLNRDYVYPGGDLDLRQLFLRQDLTKEIADDQHDIPARLEAKRGP